MKPSLIIALGLVAALLATFPLPAQAQEGEAPDKEQPAGEPDEQPAQPPGEEQPAGEPDEQPAQPPGEEQPAGEPDEQPAQPPGEEQPAGEPDEQPAEPPGEEQPAGEPEDQPAQPPGEEQPAGEPEDQPAEPPGEEQPAGEPEDQPAQPPGEEQPAGEPEDQPAEPPGEEQPAGEPGDEPGEEPGEEPPAEEPGEEPAAPVEDIGVSRVKGDRYTVSVSGRPVISVLEDLFAISGRSIPLDLEGEGPQVSVRAEEQSFWGALDAVVEKGGAYLWGAFSSAGPRIRPLPSGPSVRRPPVAHDGPIRVSLERLVRRVLFGPSPGAAPLELKAWVLPEPGVRLLGRGGFGLGSIPVRFTATDDGGRSLETPRSYLARVGGGFQLTLPMKRPSAEATSLASLTIEMDLAFAGAFEETEFPDVESRVGEEMERENLVLKIEQAEGTGLVFSVRGEGLRRQGRFKGAGTEGLDEVRVVDGAGTPVAIEGYRIVGGEGEIRYEVVLPEDRPAGLTLLYSTVKGREKRSFRFTFENVPLTE